MAITLTAAQVKTFDAGTWNVTYEITTGTNSLSKSVGALTPQIIPDSDKTASTDFNITIPSCKLTGNISGTGTISLVLIK